MQSPITFCTHGEAVSGVPSVVTFRHVHDMISTATETWAAAPFFFGGVVFGGGGACAQAAHACRVFENFRNAPTPAKKKAELLLRKWRHFRL
jgi:hypothetical protein